MSKNSQSLDYVLTIRHVEGNVKKFFQIFGTGGETRTPDTWFWRPMLYQLSYTGILFFPKMINRFWHFVMISIHKQLNFVIVIFLA